MDRVSASLSRRQIVDEAKRFVLTSGPSNMLEFGEEMIRNHNYGQWTDADVDAIRVEAVKQAERVFAFLGYEAP